MSIQIMQLLMLSVNVLLVFILFKANNNKIKWGAGIIILVMFFANPIRFKQENAGIADRKINRFDDIPEKVEVNEVDYQTAQDQELKKLKTQSGDLKNEIHN